jgi:hypothetical protein
MSTERTERTELPDETLEAFTERMKDRLRKGAIDSEVRVVERLVPDSIEGTIIENFMKPNPIAGFFRSTLTPPTGRQKLRNRLRMIRGRVDTAIDVLIGRHDCGEDW